MKSMTMTRAQAKVLRDKVNSLSRGLCRSSLDFAHALYMIKNSQVEVGKNMVPLVFMWGYDDFEEFVERELGYHYGTANAYVRVHEVFNIKCMGKWKPEDMPKSITKLKALAKVVQPDNCAWWFKEANKMSCCEVEAAVERELAGGGRMVRMRTLHVAMKAKDFEMINAAIALIRDSDLSVKRGNALAVVCSQWLEAHKRMNKLRKVG